MGEAQHDKQGAVGRIAAVAGLHSVEDAVGEVEHKLDDRDWHSEEGRHKQEGKNSDLEAPTPVVAHSRGVVAVEGLACVKEVVHKQKASVAGHEAAEHVAIVLAPSVSVVGAVADLAASHFVALILAVGCSGAIP